MDDHLEFFRACEGHRLGVISVDISANGTMAASSSQDNQVSRISMTRGIS